MNGNRGPVVASLVGVGVVLLMVVALILPKAGNGSFDASTSRAGQMG